MDACISQANHFRVGLCGGADFGRSPGLRKDRKPTGCPLKSYRISNQRCRHARSHAVPNRSGAPIWRITHMAIAAFVQPPLQAGAIGVLVVVHPFRATPCPSPRRIAPTAGPPPSWKRCPTAPSRRTRSSCRPSAQAPRPPLSYQPTAVNTGQGGNVQIPRFFRWSHTVGTSISRASAPAPRK